MMCSGDNDFCLKGADSMHFQTLLDLVTYLSKHKMRECPLLPKLVLPTQGIRAAPVAVPKPVLLSAMPQSGLHTNSLPAGQTDAHMIMHPELTCASGTSFAFTSSHDTPSAASHGPSIYKFMLE